MRSIRRTALLLHSDDQSYVDQFLPRVSQSLNEYKKSESLFEFDDLLAQVSDVLQGPQQDRLLEILRHRFSHALIDEFQDTTHQWLIFRRVFVEDSGGCLYVISDPKQAIYGFRGADIHTYMSARDTLLSCPETPNKPISLTTNFRSTESLIRSVNLP